MVLKIALAYIFRVLMFPFKPLAQLWLKNNIAAVNAQLNK